MPLDFLCRYYDMPAPWWTSPHFAAYFLACNALIFVLVRAVRAQLLRRATEVTEASSD